MSNGQVPKLTARTTLRANLELFKALFIRNRGKKKLNQIGAQLPMIEVSEEKYNECLRYCKSVEWMSVIKKSSVNRLNDGPRR